MSVSSPFWPPLLTKRLYYPEIPLFRMVEISAEYYPRNTALNYYGREISYRELTQGIDSLAGSLQRRGVKKGERVAVYTQNSPHFIISFFAAMKAGAVVVPLNPMLRSSELTYMLKDSGAERLISTAELLPNIQEAASAEEVELKNVIVGNYSDYLPQAPLTDVPDLVKSVNNDAVKQAGYELWSEVLEENQSLQEVELSPDDLCLLPYTSGSTGVPKGCMHTHRTILSNVLSAFYWMSMTPASVHLSALPYFHVTGLVHNVLAPLYAGASLVVLTRWNRTAALDLIEKLQCTHWINITAMVIDLLNEEELSQRNLTSLLVVGGGGAPLPKAVGEHLKQVTGLDYIEGYGLTETISQTHFNPPQRPKLQCIGIPDFEVDARIVDVETLQELEANQEGELVINGPEVFKGYWNMPQETEKSFTELEGKSFFRTGDICYRDEEGYFFIVDRTKRMINAAGFKIWPAEVENKLYQNPNVMEACVVGVPDAKRGEEARAYVVLKPDSQGKVSEEEIIQWCSQQMAAYKYPRQIVFVDSLPKSSTGKVLWKDLQDQAKKEVEE